MIFEQAFMALPEILTGLPSKDRDFEYEGTVMTAFSMAVLQELNGRNIINPISCFRSEATYQSLKNKRADAYLDLESLNIFTDILSNYGFYKENWLEAKFCRFNEKGNATQNKNLTTFLILKDIIRLVIFSNEDCTKNNHSNNKDFCSKSGRYLLHVYEGKPEKHIANTKKIPARIKKIQMDLIALG